MVYTRLLDLQNSCAVAAAVAAAVSGERLDIVAVVVVVVDVAVDVAVVGQETYSQKLMLVGVVGLLAANGDNLV